MTPSRLVTVGKLSTADFFVCYQFGAELCRSNTSEVQTFRNRCRDFVNHLVDVILKLHLVAADLYQGIYSFCPEFFSERNDNSVVCSIYLQNSSKGGFLSADDGKSCREEFTSFVVGIRARHADSGRSAEEIPDVVAYLLNDYSFLARKHL